MTLNQIFERNQLSVRAYNVCGQNGLHNLNLICNYYSQHSSFKKLRNCGEGTNQELIQFCKKQLAKEEETQPSEGRKKSFANLATSLTRKQREVINSFIHINSSSLSNRSQNAIKLHLQNDFKIKNFSRRILDANLDIANLKNVGKKSIPELEMYINIAREFFNEILSTQDENQLTVLKNQFLIQRTFSLGHVPTKILESESIFLLADFLLGRNAFYDKKETVILCKSLNVYGDKEETSLEDIARLLNLSRERVRQIRKKCLDDLFAKFHFLKNFNDDLYSNYAIEEDAKFIFVDNELKSRVNKVGQSNFSNNFITYILYTYRAEFYDLIGNVEDVLQKNFINHRTRHNWRSFYLVDKKISEIFNFHDLLDDLCLRVEERITETYTFNFKSYLSKFLADGELERLEEVMPIAEKVVFEELNIIVDLEDNISFERNTSKLAFEYALEALEQLGEPSTVSEIVATVRHLHPNYDTDEPKIRTAMKRIHGFVPIGRRSIFGLKKWEKELDNFKGGTIRTISKEYLLSFEEPVHKKEIARHVKRFRPKTNANSIYNNLYVDESRTFVFFENYLIGLFSKKYPDKYKLLRKTAPPSKRTWEESFETLENFIHENGRLPYSSGCPEAEQKLYRWLSVQKGKAKRNKLEESQKKVVQSIIGRFEDEKGRRRTNSKERYEELKDFIIENSRLPSAIKNGEQSLYYFHYKQRKGYETGKLDEDDKQNLIEVALLLQKYGK